MTSPIVLEGYFLQNCEFPETVSSCIPKDACVSPNNTCPSRCAEAYTGYVCSSCAYNYYRSNLSCIECPGKLTKVLTITVFSLLVLGMLYRIVKTSGRISVDVRICIQFLQTIAIFPSITNKWPKQVLSLMQICSLSNIDIELLAPECAFQMDFWTKQRIKTSIPFLLISVVSVLHFLRDVIQIQILKKRKGFSARPVLTKVCSAAVFIFVSLFVSSVSASLSPFYCDRQSDGKYVVLKNPSIQCFDSAWNERISFFIISSLTYLVIIPGFLVFVLVRHRNNRNHKAFLEKFEYLTSPYHHAFYYWELIVVLKRALFVISNNFLGASDERIWFSVYVLFFFLWMDCAALPYSTEVCNSFNITWSLICVIVLLCQRFIFDNPQGDSVAAGFGGFVIFLIVSCLCLNVKRAVQKALHNDQQSLVIPALALSRGQLSDETLMEVHYYHSLFQMETKGCLEIDVESFLLTYAKTLDTNPFANQFFAVKAALSSERQM
eukprot:TRINITY_DN4671_c0_g2_i13.p1 TRINITY_DN4671_c0_g2~~TRINITY_DN4671_c0_g2_i13.p1  ORF type:complete len:560 (-),score=108.21 TRINITY_DN4671_c0_g2_i13:587-2065(-)